MSFIDVFDFNISKIILALIITMKSTMETVTVKLEKLTTALLETKLVGGIIFKVLAQNHPLMLMGWK